MDLNAANILACPDCRGDLYRQDSGLRCSSCRKSYPVEDGIPRLLPPGGARTIDPDQLRLKSRAEALRTVSDMNRMDSGFIRQQRPFYLVYLLLVLFLLTSFIPGIIATLLFLFADWVVFRSRRGKMLDQFERHPLRLRTAADYEAVDQLYRRENRPQPTMSDWTQLSQQSRDGTPAAESNDLYDSERYLDILRVYREIAIRPEIVVDVGANDGRACHEFGIGRDHAFIGVDVSRLLLKTFLEKNPGQTAIEADGACLPLKNNSVDFLFCTETLEHLTDPAAAVRDFIRVLKPGGCLMIQSPNAHRLRNLNLFHLVALLASLASDQMLQKKVVHENTWHNAVTYHWDFSLQDYERMIRDGNMRILELGSSGFCFPAFLVGGRRDLFRMKERFFRSIPFIRYLGGDLVLVAAKVVLEPVVDPMARSVARPAAGLAGRPC